MPFLAAGEAHYSLALWALQLDGVLVHTPHVRVTARLGAVAYKKVTFQTFLLFKPLESLHEINHAVGVEDFTQLLVRDILEALVFKAIYFFNFGPFNQLFQLLQGALTAKRVATLQHHGCHFALLELIRVTDRAVDCVFHLLLNQLLLHPRGSLDHLQFKRG